MTFALSCGLGCSAVVLADLDEAQANALLGVLHGVGVPAEKTRSGRLHAIEVTPERLGAALQVAHAAGFPRPPAHSESPGLVLTPAQTANRARRRDASTLRDLLEASPQVVHAAVALQADGVAVVVRGLAHQLPQPGPLKRLIRAAVTLPDGAPIELQISALPVVVLPPPNTQNTQWAAGAAAALAALCLGLLLRIRRLKRST